ncbi:MAG: putative zinc transporter msc2 [Thelocarpon superellum]|nr:MAG: putative zinc transporter msc2 [Thelocarpon superellum]
MASTYVLPIMSGGSVNHGHGHVHSLNAPVTLDRLSSPYRLPTRSPSRHSRATASPHPPPPPHSHASSPSLPSLHPGQPEGARETMRHTPSAVAYPHSNGYGFPPMGGRTRSGTIPTISSRRSSTSWISPAEALTALSLPLPFLLASMAYQSSFPTTPQAVPAEPAFAHLDKNVHRPSHSPSTIPSPALSKLIEACAITSGTLLLVGLMGRIRATQGLLDRRKESLGMSGDTDKKSIALTSGLGVQKILVRVLGVGLPLYAAIKLGGGPVAAVLLVVSAAGTTADVLRTDLTRLDGWKRLVLLRKWTMGAIIVGLIAQVAWREAGTSLMASAVGCLALLASVFILPLPLPAATAKLSTITTSNPASSSATSAVPSTPWDEPSPVVDALPSEVLASPLTLGPQDVHVTLLAGGLLFLISAMASLLFAGGRFYSFLHLVLLAASITTAAGSLMFAQPSSLRTAPKAGLAGGLSASALFSALFTSTAWTSCLLQSIFFAAFYLAVQVDTGSPAIQGLLQQGRQLLNPGASDSPAKHSQFTGLLLDSTRDWPLAYSILSEKDSRRIFYFMTLNFAFMLVQTFYGVATGSLGLLSDSIHMLFDCLALLVGLCAAVMSKWPPSVRFPYGLGKMDTLAGFANGIFLMLISIEIITEAIERLYGGSEMKRIGELLTVSTLGLGVNLVGMLAFDHAHHGHGHGHGHGHSHGHGHAHGGHEHGHAHAEHHHDHDHSHSHHGHDHDHSKPHHQPALDGSPKKPSHVHVDKPPHSHAHPPSHAHSHSHSHSHSNENMHGIFLHILADTLGSAAVVVSTLLVHFFHWPGFDPLASCLIAILIFASAIPLVKSSAKTLLLTVPDDIEYQLRDTLAGVSGLRGVSGYCVPRFWIEGAEEGGVMGTMHVIAEKGADMEEVRERVVSFLAGRKADVVVQVEREGDGRCWCGGGILGKTTG